MRDAVQVFGADGADDCEEAAPDRVHSANTITVETTTAQLTDRRFARSINLGFSTFELNSHDGGRCLRSTRIGGDSSRNHWRDLGPHSGVTEGIHTASRQLRIIAPVRRVAASGHSNRSV